MKFLFALLLVLFVSCQGMPPAGNGHSLFFVDLNGGSEFSIQDMTLRGVALFLIDPQQDCQSCFDDLDEFFVAFSHYEEITCAYICRSRTTCDFETPLGPSYVPTALTLRERTPDALFERYRLQKGPCILVVTHDGFLLNAIRPHTLGSRAEKNRYVGALVREL